MDGGGLAQPGKEESEGEAAQGGQGGEAVLHPYSVRQGGGQYGQEGRQQVGEQAGAQQVRLFDAQQEFVTGTGLGAGHGQQGRAAGEEAAQA